jgi:hypothetical protein
MRTLWRLCTATLLCGLLAACSNPPTAGFVATTPSPAAQVAEAFRLSFNPPAVIGGRTAVGTAMLTLPAPSGGVMVTLSSGNPTVVIPPSVTVPAGAQSVDFPVSTGAVSVDTDVAMRMATANRSASVNLPMWAVLPTFFSFVSDLGDPVGNGQNGRFTPPTSRFTASCSTKGVFVQILAPTPGSFFNVSFNAPAGQPLVVGSYENATSSANAQNGSPGMSVNCFGATATGRFVVREFNVAAGGALNVFWASFEQRCNGSAGSLRGDIRISAPIDSSGIPTTCH